MALLNDYAIMVDAEDNVTVAKNAVPAGTPIQVSGRSVAVLSAVSVGNRFALIAIPPGGEVLTKAEEVHHREFQVWSEQAISL